MYLGQTPTTAAAPAAAAEFSVGRDLLAPLVQAYRERQATKAQMERARQGLPPLDLTQYSPPVRVAVGADAGVTRTVLIAGGVIGAALLLGLVLSRGRRG